MMGWDPTQPALVGHDFRPPTPMLYLQARSPGGNVTLPVHRDVAESALAHGSFVSLVAALQYDVMRQLRWKGVTDVADVTWRFDRMNLSWVDFDPKPDPRHDDWDVVGADPG